MRCKNYGFMCLENGGIVRVCRPGFGLKPALWNILSAILKTPFRFDNSNKTISVLNVWWQS